MSDIEKIKALASNIMNSFCLNEKVALVIGGSKGLGQSMALALAGAGANVCIVGRGSNGLLETAEAIKKLGQKSIYFAADVTVQIRRYFRTGYFFSIRSIQFCKWTYTGG